VSDSFDFAELFTDFRDEGRDQLALLDAALGALERRDAAGAGAGRAELLRGLHTLKGNAGMLGLRPLQDLVHGMETLLKHPPEALFGIAGAMQEAASAIRRAVEHAGAPGQDESLAVLAALRLPQPGDAPDTRSAAAGERAGDVVSPADPSSPPQEELPKTAAAPLADASAQPEKPASPAAALRASPAARKPAAAAASFQPGAIASPESPRVSTSPASPDISASPEAMGGSPSAGVPSASVATADSGSASPGTAGGTASPENQRGSDEAAGISLASGKPRGLESAAPRAASSEKAVGARPGAAAKSAPGGESPEEAGGVPGAASRDRPAAVASSVSGGSVAAGRTAAEGAHAEADASPEGVAERRAAEGAAGLPQASDMREEVLRVPFARLDAMLHQVGELATAAAGLEAWVAANRAELEAVGLRRAATERVEALAATVEATGRSARQLRTVPVARVFGRFPPLAGDLARAQGKQVRVVLEGEQTELDKSTADAILDPLLHLVRNAVDHGVETPAEREAAGKPPAATLWLRAVSEGEMVRIEVEDDGRGLDGEAMLRRARELGWVGPAEVPPPAELADFVFRPGFSTRADVTELSGRGIGLDVVRSTVARLRGTVEVEQGDEGGARFVLRLPLTVALVPVLFMESAGQVLAIAASDVEEATRVGSVATVGAAEVVDVRGEALAVIRPSRLFGWEAAAEPRLAVVVRRGARAAAILADRLLEQRPATIRPLPAALGSPRGVSGATLDADGRVVLLLDAGEMMQLNVDLYREGARAQ
jgi:two-component system chemotaxis sensor kinase CheA